MRLNTFTTRNEAHNEETTSFLYKNKDETFILCISNCEQIVQKEFTITIV